MKKRIVSLLLTLAMCLSLLPASAVTAGAAQAEQPVKTAAELAAKTAAEAAVQNAPTATTAAQAEAQPRKVIAAGAGESLGYDATAKTYDTLYFGTYRESLEEAGEPYPWRILDAETSLGSDGLFLLSEKFYNVYFCYGKDDEEIKAITHNNWQDEHCYARVWCEALAANKAKFFTDKELNLLVETSKYNSGYHSTDKWFYYDDMWGVQGSIFNGGLSDAKVFFLSAQEYEDPRYGLTEVVGSNKLSYVLRSGVSGKHTMDDQSTLDSFVAVATPDNYYGKIQRWSSYWKMYTGQKMIYEQTWADRIFGFSEYFPFLTEEVYSYEYRQFNARPAMNLDGAQILYTVAADNSSRVPYGTPADYTGTEWKLILSDGTTAFKDGTSLADNRQFDVDGGTLTVNHPAFGGSYDAVTATLLDPKGNIVCYGTISEDPNATTSTVTIPGNLSDGVYTLRISAEQWNGEKVTDLATVPFEAEVKVANAHVHKLCWEKNCTDGCEDKIWRAVTTLDELAAMEPDGYYFLIGDLAVDGTTEYRGHLCLNQSKLTGTLRAGDGFTLCACQDSRNNKPVEKIVVADGAEVTLYGFAIDAIEVGANATLNIRNGKNNYNPNMNITKIGEHSVVNQYGANLDGTDYVHSIVPELVIKDTVTVNIFDGRIGYTSLLSGGVLNIHGGSTTKVCAGEAGSAINIYGGRSGIIETNGDLNLHTGFKGMDDITITKPINICGELATKPGTPHRVTLLDANGKASAGKITNGWAKYMGDASFNDYYVLDANGYRNYKANDGEIYTKVITHETGSHPICGVECTHDGAHPALEWTEVNTWAALKSLLEADGTHNVCLTSDLSTQLGTEVIKINGQINFCLHGYKLNLQPGATGGHFEVKSGASLNITDCVGTGAIENGRGRVVWNGPNYSTGGAIYLPSGATATLYGGTIATSSSDLGGAVYVAQGATFTMKGGTLDGNWTAGTLWNGNTTVRAAGGAVYLAGGTFILDGGTLTKNNVLNKETSENVHDGGGAVYIADNGRFVMNGGTITGSWCRPENANNTDWNGNAVRVYSGTFEMNGGTFDWNDAYYIAKHNTVYVDSGSTFTMTGGSFENASEQNVVYLAGGATFNMTGGTFNNAGKTAVRPESNATFNMSGGKIIGGKRSNYEFTGVVNLLTGSKFNMTGGEITDCSVGVYMEAASTFTMTDGAIKNCTYGVRVWGDSTGSKSTIFTMKGGRIGGGAGSTRNYTGYGVGVYQNGTFNLQGGEISGYYSDSNATTGGVDVWETGTLNISGSPRVVDNYTARQRGTRFHSSKNRWTAYVGLSSNINLHPGAKLSVSGLTGKARFGLTLRGYKNGDTAGNDFYQDVSNGYTFNGDLKVYSQYKNYFFSDNAAFTLGSNGTYMTIKGTPVDQSTMQMQAKTKSGTTTIDQYNGSITLAPGETVELTAVLGPDTATNKKYRWICSSPYHTVTVDISGNTITAKKEDKEGDDIAIVALLPLAGDLSREPRYLEIHVAAKSYTVKFVMNDHGTQVEDLEATPHKTISVEDPTELGYTFVAWYTDPELTQHWDMETDTVEGDMTLYAKWQPGVYSILLEANGGTCSARSLLVRYLSAYGELPVPTREDYDFLGWFTAAEGGEKVTEETVLDTVPTQENPVKIYAHWKARSCTVALDTCGGNPLDSITAPIDGVYGELPVATREGYTFGGWFTTADETGKQVKAGDAVDTEIKTLYAHWKANAYTVTFNANGGDAITNALTVSYDGTYGTLPTPTRTGYNFAGWFTAAVDGKKIEATDTVKTAKDHVLYAHWTAGQYTVTLDPGKGECNTKTIGVSYDGTYADLPTAEREGYTFDGWFTEAAVGTQVTTDTSVTRTEDHTLYAHWTANTYKVRFETNEGSPAAEITVTFDGKYTNLPITSRTGYTFAGWYTAAVDGMRVDETTTVTTAQDHTLYAYWTPNTYKVTFDTDGGSAAAELEVTFDGTYGTLPATTRKGYTFDGWFTTKDGSDKVEGTDKVITAEDHTLYAHWTVNTYQVSFDANGGSAAAEMSVTFDAAYGTLPTPTRTGYTFDGWFTAKDGGDKVEETTTVTTDANHTLYAHWTANNYKVTFDTDGGSAAAELTVTYDDTYGALPKTTRAGYTFDGWFTAKDGGEQVKDTTTVTTAEDHTLYAHWTVLPADRPVVSVCEDLTLTYGYQDGSISVTGAAAQEYVLTFQWYRCGKDGADAEVIENATAATYALPTGMAAGTTYYRCEVTATRKDNGQKNTVLSDIITVNVVRAVLTASLTMAGYTYGETVSVPALTGNTENGTVTYYYQSTGAERKLWQDITPTTLNAGSYTLIAVIGQTANYNGCEVTASFTVAQATPVVTEWPTLGTIYVNDTLKTDWTGAASVDGAFTVSGETKWSEAGAQTTELTFTPADTVNYTVLTHEASVTVIRRTVKAVTTTVAAVTDKNYGTELSALGLPTAVSIVTEDGKSFENVPVTWNGYDAALLTEQTLTGTPDLSAIANEVMQPDEAVAASATVTLRELTPGSVTFADKTATYTGEAIAHTIEGTVTGVASVRYEYEGADYAASETAPTDVGTYTVTATFTMEPGYTQLASISATLTIEKADGSLTAPTAAELTYNGQRQALLLAGLTATGTLEYKLDGGEYGTAIPEATAAGTYTVFYRVVGDKNHKDVAEQQLTVTIAPKPVTEPTADSTSFTYNGTAQTYAVTENSDYTVTGNVQTNAGSYTVTVALNDKDNTVWASDKTAADLTFAFAIQPASVMITAADKLIYVGETAPDLSAAKAGEDYTVTGLIGEDALTTQPTLRYDPAQPDTSAVGEAKICAEGADAGSNYVISYTDGKLTVTDRPLYAIEAVAAEHGTLLLSATSAIEGTVITVTAMPDEGYRLASVTATDAAGNALTLTDAGNGLYTFTMPASVVTLQASFTKVDEQTPFDDIRSDDYYYDAIRWAVDNGVTEGYGDGVFAPDIPCTRAQFVTFLWRAAGKPEPAKQETPFTDVAADAYYAKAVAWAVEEGVTTGVTETTFCPDETCTRAQTVTFLYRAYRAVPPAGEPKFTDVAPDAYYADAVKWAAENEVTFGVGNGLFAPDDFCTRAQTATFLWRLYGKQ